MYVNICSQTRIPSVQVEDITGKQVDVTSFIGGKPVIISFWGVTCKPCLIELNALNECVEEWKEYVDFDIIAVSIDDARFASRARSMAKGYDWRFICLFDKNQDLKRVFNVSFTPHTFIIDSHGKMVYSHTGYVPGIEDELFEKLKELK